MNLKHMIDQCAFGLNYSPENEQYRNEIISELNDSQETISTQEEWLFLVRRTQLTVKAPDEGSSANTVSVVTATNPYNVLGTGGTSFDADCAGQTFIGPDGVERTITHRPTSTSIFVEPPLESDFTNDDDWSIVFKTYQYPPFASEILGISSREDDRGKLKYFNWGSEERMFLDADHQGPPDYYVEDEHLSLDAPQEPGAITTAGGGTLVSGTVYQYVFTIVGKGLESPPSEPLEVTIGVGGSASLTGLPDLQDPDGPWNRGYRKQLYRRNKTINGRWQLLDTIAASGTTYTDDGSVSPSIDPADVLYDHGPRPTFRVWTTPEEDLTLDVRYLLRPRKLQADTDTPVWPVEYHKLIVWDALVQLCVAHGMPQQSEIYRRRAALLMGRMKAKYLSRKDRKFVRQSFSRHRFGDEFRNGTPRKV